MFNVDEAYQKDKDLKREDVQAVLEWTDKQPHLPKLSEHQAILFLQSCYYRNEAAKAALDTYFTVKTLCPDLFLNRNPNLSPLKEGLSVGMYPALPKKTPEGYTVLFCRFADLNPDHFNFALQLKSFDMATMLMLNQQGTAAGHVIAIDLQGVIFGHLTKLGPLTMKKFLYYLQISDGHLILFVRLMEPNLQPLQFCSSPQVYFDMSTTSLLNQRGTFSDYVIVFDMNSIVFEPTWTKLGPLTLERNSCFNYRLFTQSPKKTPEGYTILFSKFVDCNPDNYNFNAQIKYFDMSTILWLNQNGTSAGHILCMDFQGVAFGHLTKLGPLTMKKLMYYLQEAMPVRLKALHYFNIVPFMDKILALMKPFMKKEMIEMLYLHNTVDDLIKFIPRECLPQDYGGSAESCAVLHEKVKKNILDNTAFFEFEDKQLVDESKRPGKPKNAGDYFGVEGTFKKLELD